MAWLFPPYIGNTKTTRLISSPLELEEMRVVDMALGCFGEISGTALINQTHREPPWKNVYRPGRPSQVISNESIYEFFKKTLEFTEDEF